MNLFLRLFLFLPGPGLSAQSSGVPGGNKLPPLQPPHGQLLPSFWDQNAWTVVIATLLALALVVLVILWARRPLPAVVVAPDVLARRDLETLRGQPENGVLLMNASSILRRYVIFACGLPPGELTTAELAETVATRPLFSPDLAAAVVHFLRQCDERKFSPDSSPSSLDAVATALSLIEKIEQRRRQPAEPASATS